MIPRKLLTVSILLMSAFQTSCDGEPQSEAWRALSRMEAKDGSTGFDFEGTYTRVVPKEFIGYRMSDGREVEVEFADRPDGVHVRETFDAETTNPTEMQQQGWQAILDNFARHVERKGEAGSDER